LLVDRLLPESMAAAQAVRQAWLRQRSPAAHSFLELARLQQEAAVVWDHLDNAAAGSVLVKVETLAAEVAAAPMAGKTSILVVAEAVADLPVAPEASSAQMMAVAAREAQAADRMEGQLQHVIRLLVAGVLVALPMTGKMELWASMYVALSQATVAAEASV
jgi:hypothetical protein